MSRVIESSNGDPFAIPPTLDATNRQRVDGTGRFAASLATAQRDGEAAKLRTAGKTYQYIADVMGYDSRATASEAVKRAMLAARQEAGAEARAVEVARLDALVDKLTEIMNTPHVKPYNGPEFTIVEYPDDGPAIAAAKTLLQVQARRAALLGLDSPTKVEATVYEVVINGVDPKSLA